jgi:hypothetical protein
MGSVFRHSVVTLLATNDLTFAPRGALLKERPASRNNVPWGLVLRDGLCWLDDRRNTGVSLGSIPLSGDVTASTGASRGRSGLAAAIAVRKPLREEPGHTGDLAALDRSASLFEAYGAASFDKFSTQKRRTEMTAKSAFGRQHVAHRDSKPRRLPGGHGDPAGIFAYPSHYLASIHVAL